MRDLKRSNAKLYACKFLEGLHFEVFTPFKWTLSSKGGKRKREKVPVIRDLFFVHTTRDALDPIVERNPTIQYCYERGSYRSPMRVADDDMERFIHAVNSSQKLHYYKPGELTPDMYGNRVHIMGGPLDGYEGRLLALRGERKRRLLVELPNFLSVGVEVEAEYIELLTT
jgi:transcription antitermination factor NusG